MLAVRDSVIQNWPVFGGCFGPNAATPDPPIWAEHDGSGHGNVGIEFTEQDLPLMRRKPFLLQLVTAAVAAWCLGCGPSAAEVSVSGTRDRMVLQTTDATTADILAALHSAFGLEVKFKGATARRFTGVYSGSIRQVLSRLLAGDDYILRSGSEGMSILLVGRSAGDSAAVASNLAAATPGDGAQVSRFVALRQGRLKRQSD
jgi:hypothetical protein